MIKYIYVCHGCESEPCKLRVSYIDDSHASPPSKCPFGGIDNSSNCIWILVKKKEG